MPKDTQVDRRDNDNLSKIYDALALATTLYSDNLRNQPAAIEYLQGRELSGQTAKDFQLGFAQDAWGQLFYPPAKKQASLKTPYCKQD